MKTAVKVLVGIVLVLIAVIGLYTVNATVWNTAGANVTDSGNDAGGKLDCVLTNPGSAEEKCQNSDYHIERGGEDKYEV